MKDHFGLRRFSLLAVAVAGVASHCAAGTIVTVPPGLAPGSQYRLAFVTDDPYHATSSNIAVYNSDVNTEADSVLALDALGTTWLAIGSTATVNAIDNIGIDSGVPIYNLEGQLIADDASAGPNGLFASTTPSTIDNFVYTESGTNQGGAPVWTGTGSDGRSYGSYALGSTDVVFGTAGVSRPGGWIEGEDIQAFLGFDLYAISDPLTVPPGSPTPEPTTTAMAVAALALAFAARRRFHRSRRATRALG
jgi:MYXO-CTERM domain-containing protein